MNILICKIGGKYPKGLEMQNLNEENVNWKGVVIRDIKV